MTDTISQRYSRHCASVRLEDIPAPSVDAAKILILDTIGVGIAGAATDESARLADTCLGWGGVGHAAVWGTGLRMHPIDATMVNAHQAHCLEFDAIHEPAVVHPMTVLLPALLADAQERRSHGEVITGGDLVAAVAVGVDIAGGLGDVTTTALQFFRPGTAGVFGAVGAIGNARHLATDVITHAMGIAYGALGGTMQPHSEGSSLLPLQIGFNGRNAIAAIDLAVAGATGPLEIFEGRFGYFRLIEAGGEPEVLAERLGKQWEVSLTSLKPFPSGRATHSAIDATLRLKERHGFAADDVVSVRIDVPPMVHRLCARPLIADPTPNYLRLSIPFQVASALVDGFVDLSTSRPDRFRDPEIHRHAQNVSIAVDDNPDPNAFDPQTITVTLDAGTEHSVTLPRVLGSPSNPLDRDSRLEKFRNCLAYGAPDWTRGRANRIIELVDRLNELDDAGELLDLL